MVNDSCCRAPGVSHLTARKVLFSGTCTTTTGSTPDHTYVVAKVCAPHRKMCAIDPPSHNSHAGHGCVTVPGMRSIYTSFIAVTRTLRRRNCRYNRVKG